MILLGMPIRGVIFDLLGTLVKLVSSGQAGPIELSAFLRELGYEVYFQEFKAAYQYAVFIDCPKLRPRSYSEFLSQVLRRLGLELTESELSEFVRFYREGKGENCTQRYQ